MKRILKLAAVIGMVMALVLAIVVPVSATVANPTTITIPSVRVFENVYTAGDMLFIVETNPAYSVAPTPPPTSTFTVQIMDPTGATVLASRPLDYYNHYFSAIYLTAAQVASSSFATAYANGTAYQIWLTGNPVYFSPLTLNTNYCVYTLSSAQYVVGTLGATGTTPVLLQAWCIQLANSCAPGAWLDTSGLLNSTGGPVFLTEIPALGSVCPNLFETSASYPGYVTGTVSKTEETALTARQGTRLQTAMTNLGIWMGMGPTLGGPILETVSIAILCFMVAGGLFVATGSSAISVVVGVIPTIFAGNMIGLLPLTLTFVLGFLVVLTFGITFILSHL